MSEQTISILLQGNKGSSLKEEAFQRARAALCIKDSEEGCQCQSCLVKNLNMHPDFKYIAPTDKRSIGVDDIMPILSMNRTVPLISNRSVVIVDGFDLVTEQAQNKLLKTLEEQSNFFLIGLCYSDNVLPTVKSRMHIITKGSMPRDKFLFTCKKNNLPDVLLLYYMTGGHYDLVEDMLDVRPAFNGVLECLQEGNYSGILQSLHMVSDKDKESFANVAREYIPHMYSFLIAIFAEWMNNLYHPHVANLFNLPKCNPSTLAECVTWLEKELKICRSVTYTTASFEVTIFNIIGMLLCDKER